MRSSRPAGIALGLFLLAGLSQVLAQPARPVIAYPNADDAFQNIKRNPTIFWSAYSRPGAGFERDIQKNFQIQIADALPFDATTVVYTTDSGPGTPPDCSASPRPRCLGAGMAHFVGDQGSYAGVFANALAGKDRLDEGTQYHLRMRVQSEQDGTWSAWSDTVMFTTVAYDGDTYYVSSAGVDGAGCGGPTTECASLGYVLKNLVADDHGDTVIIRPGTYDVPCASSHPSCPQNSPVDIDFVNNDFPRRLRIAGESATLRPILQLGLFVDAPDVGWMMLQRARDVIFENLIFSGPEACCQGMDSNNSYVILMDGRGQNRNERLSFINVETRRNVVIQQNSYPYVGGEIDVLWLKFRQQGEPRYDFAPWSNRNDNNNPKLLVTRNSMFLTFKGFDSRDVDDHIVFASEYMPEQGLPFTYRHILIEDSQFYRANIHPFRPSGAVEDFTLRRTRWGDGAEHQPGFSGPDTSVRNAVFENNTIVKGLRIGNNNGDSAEAGTIGYLVIRNNIFTRVDIGDSGGVLQVTDVTDSKVCYGRCSGGTRNGLWCGWCDREVLTECTSDSQCNSSCNICPGGACVDTCDILGTGDRISVDYNIYHVPWDYFSVIHWDGDGSSCSTNKNGSRGGLANCYSRRGGQYSENWDAWLALGYDVNAPYQTYNGGANREPVDPMLMYVPFNDGSQGYADLRLQAGSPAIDAGDPDTWVPPGGGSRVDIGGYEALLGPVITPIDPEDGATCVPEGTSVVTFRIDAAPGSNVDVGTLSVQVAGASVVPDVIGSGASVLVSVDVPGGPFPASTLAEVEVSVSDDAVPARASDLSYFFLTQPAAPTGVVAE
ncbi:MAG: hypothetical protein PVF68_01110 [Acidobacteriota bacterium]|jgi:hypothetical protein